MPKSPRRLNGFGSLSLCHSMPMGEPLERSDNPQLSHTSKAFRDRLSGETFRRTRGLSQQEANSVSNRDNRGSCMASRGYEHSPP